jgi:osmotically-inducible protein OsmY
MTMTDNDRELQKHVQDELDWEPSVDAAHIGVAAKAGVITLTGHVSSYAEKLAAELAVRRVRGVRAIAQDIEVRLPNERKTADDEIAARALQILAWDASGPIEDVAIKVEKGWVTLSGKVNWHYQRAAAERAVQRLTGIRGITNCLQVKVRVQPADVRHRIEAALRRGAELDAARVTISVADGGKVVLGGQVKSWHERQAAELAAWAAPGVVQVEDRIAVG